MRRIDSAQTCKNSNNTHRGSAPTGQHSYFVAYFAARPFGLNVQFAYCKALTYADDDNVVANVALHFQPSLLQFAIWVVLVVVVLAVVVVAVVSPSQSPIFCYAFVANLARKALASPFAAPLSLFLSTLSPPPLLVIAWHQLF